MAPEWLEELDIAAERLRAQLRFILELDAAKSVLRRNYLSDGSRLENDGEHMWHVAVAAAVLAEHSDAPLDRARLIEMLLVHDIVEIDAGDTFVYDQAAQADKAEREQRAFERIFGLLPPDQRRHFRELWDEFEEKATPEARMAAAIDRILPLLLNRATDGISWRENGVTADRVRALNSQIARGSSGLWAAASATIEDAVANGHLPET